MTDRDLLGPRAADAMRAENAGLTTQRCAAIRSRRREWGWLVEYRDGIPVGMVWRGWP